MYNNVSSELPRQMKIIIATEIQIWSCFEWLWWTYQSWEQWILPNIIRSLEWNQLDRLKWNLQWYRVITNYLLHKCTGQQWRQWSTHPSEMQLLGAVSNFFVFKVSFQWLPHTTSYFKILLWRRNNGLSQKNIYLSTIWVGRRSNVACAKAHVGDYLSLKRKRKRRAGYAAWKIEKKMDIVPKSQYGPLHGLCYATSNITGWNKMSFAIDWKLFISIKLSGNIS